MPCWLRADQGNLRKQLSKSRKSDPFDGITESDIEDAAPESLVIDELVTLEKLTSNRLGIDKRMLILTIMQACNCYSC